MGFGDDSVAVRYQSGSDVLNATRLQSWEVVSMVLEKGGGGLLIPRWEGHVRYINMSILMLHTSAKCIMVLADSAPRPGDFSHPERSEQIRRISQVWYLCVRVGEKERSCWCERKQPSLPARVHSACVCVLAAFAHARGRVYIRESGTAHSETLEDAVRGKTRQWLQSRSRERGRAAQRTSEH